ncbi:MAG: hypothetical protein ACRBHB_19130 [Arenicella sp.]
MMIHKQMARACLLLAAACLLQACDPAKDSAVDVSQEQAGLIKKTADNKKRPVDQDAIGWIVDDNDIVYADERKVYQQRLTAVLQSERPVLLLDDLLDPNAVIAQDVALEDSRFMEKLFHPKSRLPLRNEIMTVKRALPSDRIGEARQCQPKRCYRVDMYNFFYNLTTTAIVDVAAARVMTVNSLPETQPDLSMRLQSLAIAIARDQPEVRQALRPYLATEQFASAPEDLEPVMANIKTALKDSRCERSEHLCVAPTYVLGDRALWVIVDLTDLRVVGLRWTELGTSGPPVFVSERTIENEHVFYNFCEKETLLQQSGWSLSYNITSSDGLRVANVTHNGQPVFNSAKLVDWHVSYSRKNNFGYSDAIGCPMFSSAVVVAYNGPIVEPIVEAGVEVGFALVQDFRQQPWPAPCNYRYEQRFEFYHDGRFRIAMADYGRGCGTDGTYRPVLRIDMGKHASGQAYQVQAWDEQNWQTWDQESWSFQNDLKTYYQQKYTHRLLTKDGDGYLLEPGNQQFNDAGRGDNAYVYAAVSHTDKEEGEQDLVTLGSCCNTDYRQGPEQFIEPPEPLLNEGVVLWYVAQMKNDGNPGSEYCWADTVVEKGVKKIKVWPCFAGPMFTPVQQVQ